MMNVINREFSLYTLLYIRRGTRLHMLSNQYNRRDYS